MNNKLCFSGLCLKRQHKCFTFVRLFKFSGLIKLNSLGLCSFQLHTKIRQFHKENSHKDSHKNTPERERGICLISTLKMHQNKTNYTKKRKDLMSVVMYEKDGVSYFQERIAKAFFVGKCSLKLKRLKGLFTDSRSGMRLT